jgi:hypothetical protein
MAEAMAADEAMRFHAIQKWCQKSYSEDQNQKGQPWIRRHQKPEQFEALD